MDTIDLLGSTLGIGFVSGIRLYATILALGLAIHFDKFHLNPGQEKLAILGTWPVLIAAGVACLAEFFADKIPLVDSLWDSFHTFIRPIGAVVLSASLLGSIDPTLKLVLVILAGGVALAGHSSKAAARVAINHSPEPFTNIGASLAGDLFAPAGLWLSFHHPAIVLVLVAIFLAVFAWLAPKVFRALSMPVAAFRKLVRRAHPAEAPL
jgi:Domain of unknown function (DUF4126)